jgi:hypothetical protein
VHAGYGEFADQPWTAKAWPGNDFPREQSIPWMTPEPRQLFVDSFFRGVNLRLPQRMMAFSNVPGWDSWGPTQPMIIKGQTGGRDDLPELADRGRGAVHRPLGGRC